MSINPASFNPHDPLFLANPFPTYAAFRKDHPVAHVMPYDSWWCFRFDDCKSILTDDKTFVKNNPIPPSQAPPMAALASLPKSVFASDNPHHDQVRPLLDKLLSEAIVHAPTIATTLAEQLLVKAKAVSRFELISNFATPLPAGVLQKILGFPSDDLSTLVQWVTTFVLADDIAASLAVKGAGITCALAISEYFNALSRCPMHQSGSMFELMRNQVEAGSPNFSKDDWLANASTLMIAGYASTTFLISSGVVRLTDPLNQDQLSLLLSKPQLIEDAVREMLRIDSPVQLIDRYPTKKVTIGEVTLHPGDKVTAVIGSANHDEKVFPNPDEFDITRQQQCDFGFGMGIHKCLGAPLARLVTPAAFRVLLAQLPNLRLEGTVTWQSDPFLRAPSSVPIGFG